jgi:ribosomal protein L14
VFVTELTVGSMAQIMTVTGHKSASSVAVFQRVSSKEKQVMGDIITSSVRGEQPFQLFVSSSVTDDETCALALI